MTGPTRRHVLKGAVVAGAVAAVPPGAMRASGAEVRVFDSRLGLSRAFGNVTDVDLARGAAATRAALLALPQGAAVEGLTRWSDWIAVRGLLAERGWRTHTESRAPGPGNLFRWAMRPR